MLCCLLESWNHLVTSISFSTTDSLEFDYVVGALFSKEVQRKYNIETSTPEAMVARVHSTKKGEGSRDKSRSKLRGKKS